MDVAAVGHVPPSIVYDAKWRLGLRSFASEKRRRHDGMFIGHLDFVTRLVRELSKFTSVRASGTRCDIKKFHNRLFLATEM